MRLINSAPKKGIFSRIKKAAAYAFISSIGYFGINCGGKDNTTATTVIPDTTKVLDDSTTQQLLDYSEETHKLTFSESTPQLETLAAGDIIVCNVNNITPNGLLRKVENITFDSNGVVVDTSQATLEDAIIRGSAELNQELNPTNIKSFSAKKGVSLKEPSSFNFNIPINNVVLYDADGDEINTTNDQITANGDISFNSSFNWKIRLNSSRLEEIVFANTNVETAQIELIAQMPVLSYSKKIEIARFNFKPIVTFIGHVPVILTPIISVNVGLNGEVSIGTKIDVAQEASITAGLNYYKGAWTPISSFSNNFVFKDPVFSARVWGKEFTGPQLSLLLYNVTGPYAGINGYGELNADINKSPLWILYGGLEGNLGVKFEVLSRTIAEYSAKVIDFKKVLNQSDTITFVSNRDGNAEIYIMNEDGSNVTRLTNNSFIDFHPVLSPDWSKIVFSSNRDGNYDIYTMNPDGTGVVRLTDNPAEDNSPIWSPDGKKIAFYSKRYGNMDIFIMDKDGSNVVRLTNNAANDYEPAFSPDGSKIAFYSLRDGNTEIYLMNKDGSNQTNLTNNPAADYYPSFSPDGNMIVFQSDRDGDAEIYKMNKDGTGVIRLTNNSANDYGPFWSPDGSKIVFMSNRDGNWEIYSMDPDGGSLMRLTNDIGIDDCPAWSP